MSPTQRIFALLKQKNITATALSRETGISTSNISDWKNGKSNPSADAIAKIADYFTVSTDYILGRTDSPSSSGDVFAQSSDSEYADLPPEALEELENFKQYVIQKYKKK